MNNSINESSDDEIDLMTAVEFIKRQSKSMAVTFIVFFIVALSYALSRPTLYQSEVSLVIGEKLYFLQQQQQQQQQLIENFDEIKYALKEVSVNPIKNTKIIELQATSEFPQAAETTINLAVNKLILKHNELLTKKKSEFTELLKSISSSAVSKTELINLLDNASNSNQTRITSSVTTKTLRYSGRFTQIIGIGFIIAFFISLVFGLTKDWIEKNKLNSFAKTYKPTTI